LHVIWTLFEAGAILIALVGFPIFTYYLVASDTDLAGKVAGAVAAGLKTTAVIVALATGVFFRRKPEAADDEQPSGQESLLPGQRERRISIRGHQKSIGPDAKIPPQHADYEVE
jgi:hypothetical protein